LVKPEKPPNKAAYSYYSIVPFPFKQGMALMTVAITIKTVGHSTVSFLASTGVAHLMDWMESLRATLNTMPTPFNMLVVWVALLDCAVVTPMILLNRPDGTPEGKKRFLVTLLATTLPLGALMAAATVWQLMY
jgi:hypothetical protein